MIQRRLSTKRHKRTIARMMSLKNLSIPPTAGVRLDSNALVSNWRTLNRLSGDANAGAAVKADAYGLGVRAVVERLLKTGCKDFFVANWQEALEIEDLTAGKAKVSVLNGVRSSDMDIAVKSAAKPVLNSIEQLKRWENTRLECDIMIESGMNRLGIEAETASAELFAKLNVDLLISHLASADEDVEQNTDQLSTFLGVSENIKYKRRSLANSAGIALGNDYHFDCTRPGLSLYGGIQRSEFEGLIEQVATPQAEILQIRSLKPGDRLGYNAKYIADRNHDIAILAMGYADGYLCGFSNSGIFLHGGQKLPVLGRVSMDLIAIDISNAPELGEGDWVDCMYELPTASTQSGLSQYELITGLGQRLERIWT